MFFEDILGQDDAKRLFKAQIQQDKPGHAYILNGEDGSGKTMLAEAFAAGINCEAGEGRPCCQCHSCKQAMSHNHPDIIYLDLYEDNKKKTKKKSYGVDDIRNKINATVDIAPYNGRYKVYIIDDAQAMGVESQNALLKTIEEPPEYVIILLLTNNAGSFLQTIISRCIQIDTRPLPDETIRGILKKEYNMVDYEVDVCVSFAQGNLTKARNLASSEEFHGIKDSVVGILKKIHSITTADMNDYVAVLKKDDSRIGEYLNLFTLWYRDVLLYKSTGSDKGVIFREDLFTLKTQSSRYSYDGLNRIFEAIEEVKRNLSANVNFELTLELMLITMKESYT